MNKKTLIILTCVLLNLTTFASETVRIASYNIRICANKTYHYCPLKIANSSLK